MPIDDLITFRKLEVFLRFLDFGNMARVAEVLDLSAVSVHRALHSLEEGLGCPLFRRDGRRLIPLASAYAFAEYATRAIADCQSGIDKARQAAGMNAARLKIGALYSLTLRTMPRLLMGFKTRRPNVDVDLTLGSNQELLRKLYEGELGAIVIALHEGRVPADLQAVPIFDDDIWFAAPLNSPYAEQAEMDLRTLRDADFVTLGDDFATYRDFSQAFEKAGFEPRIAMRVGDIFSLINLVSGGLGYALLPGRIAEFSTQIQLIPLARRYAASQNITLLFPQNRERDPNLLALAAECRVFGR